DVVERRAPVVEKWSTLLQGTNTPNLTAVASFLLSIPITNASVERVFSLMTAAWTDQRNRCSVELIKSEIQVKINFEYSYKEFYTYALKEKALLEAARSSKKYKVKKSIQGEHGIREIMPFEEDHNQELATSRCALIPDKGHLAGHYPFLIL
ncbi:hypothetical protein KUCAC02_000519, partial [Chaenocephalus aceratus]